MRKNEKPKLTRNEVKLLYRIQSRMRKAGSRLTLNPAFNIPTNIQWLTDAIGNNEAQNAILNDAISRLVGSSTYKKRYLQEKPNDFFATTT